MSAKPQFNSDSRIPQTAPKFKVGDYAAGKSGYYAGFIVASSPQIVYFTWPSQVDDILFYGPPDDMVLIMPAAAAPYFEQFVGDEGGAE